jgi:hypothetical protein
MVSASGWSGVSIGTDAVTLFDPGVSGRCAANNPTGSGQVMAGELAKVLNWHPSLVEACVQELYSAGAFSNVTHWTTTEEISPSMYFNKGTAAVTPITRGLAEFISR